MIPHIYNGNGTISLMLDGKMRPIDTAHRFYEEIKAALKDQNWDVIPDLVNLVKKVAKAIDTSTARGRVVVKDGEVLYDGTPIHNTLTTKIVQMATEGYDIGYMAKFLENLMQNPSYRAVQELYDFLSAGAIPITENGTFLGYKKIKDDWKDIYTGKMDNSIGTVVRMPRNMVNEDSSVTCSHGLHVCSYDYLSQYGSSSGCRVVIVEVNPRDVVAIPKDYNNTKMRVCEYTVISEVDNYRKADVFTDKTVVYTTSKKPEGDKEIGKMVTAMLDDDELPIDHLEYAAFQAGLTMDQTKELADIANQDTKWAGKKIARYIRTGVLNADEFQRCLDEEPDQPAPAANDEPAHVGDCNGCENCECEGDAKEIGKKTTAALEGGKITPEQLVDLLTKLNQNGAINLPKMRDFARTDRKRAGKWIRDFIGQGWIASKEYLKELNGITATPRQHTPQVNQWTTGGYITKDSTGAPAPANVAKSCYRCGSNDISANGQCGKCHFYNSVS